MKPQKIIEQIDNLRVQLMYSIIEHIWHEDIDDFWVEVWTNWVVLADFYVSESDMAQIVRHNIPRVVCFEYWDYQSLNYCEDWIKKAKKEDKDFLRTLYLFYKKREWEINTV